ncbi:aromatic prenyltransferase [Hypomontagnella monticulosa]|nr:aromatic prenyltransferase [Hypomontagnella monticulosa]
MEGNSNIFLSLTSAGRSLDFNEAGSQYWWETTGRDLANMLRVAKYPDRTQRSFLLYYKDFLCPLLGSAVEPNNETHMKSWTWDGSTHEYSFELKASSKAPDVRFVADFGQLRPVDWEKPLDSTNTEKVVSSLATCVPEFDDTWYQALKTFMDCSHVSVPTQKVLIAEAGHLSPLLIGFDILREVPADVGILPVLGKVYFLPCIAAAAQKRTRFEYLASKPKDWENGARFLATDLVSPEKARLKLYLRCPDSNFDTIWDYFTLGGRIPGLNNFYDQYREFVTHLERVGGDTRELTLQAVDKKVETGNRRKLTTMYFSLDSKYPYPAPKIAFYVRNVSANDTLVARSLDRWLSKYGWDDGDTSMEEQVSDAM